MWTRWLMLLKVGEMNTVTRIKVNWLGGPGTFKTVRKSIRRMACWLPNAIARDGLLLKQADPVPTHREVDRRAGARWATTNDDRVETFAHLLVH